MEQKKCKSYQLRDENGGWLGQIVLTEDGMFSGVTDYGNLSNVWRHIGDKDFREFLINLNVPYFGSKLYTMITDAKKAIVRAKKELEG